MTTLEEDMCEDFQNHRQQLAKSQAAYLDHVKKELKLNLDQFCAENGYQERDTSAFVFNNEGAESYAQGFNAAIEMIE